MEKQPSYFLLLPLEQMVFRRIAVSLYDRPFILASIAKLKWDVYFNIWDDKSCILSNKKVRGDWREAIHLKLSRLVLPESLTKQMLPILKAVGYEIFKWKLIHEAYLSDSDDDFNARVLAKLHWTTSGAVDYRKTAEDLLLCDVVVDVVKRFELACLYCLEDHIPVLWEKLPEENKRTFCESQIESPRLELFLPCILERRKSELNHDVLLNFIPSNSFECAALHGNKTLTEFCFRKLLKEEREASLVRTAKAVIKCRNRVDRNFNVNPDKRSDIACYLLTLMTPEEQIGIFKEMPLEVLRCFADWPWKDLFLDIAYVIWPFLPESRYDDLLNTIFLSRLMSVYYFPDVFQNFFLQSPVQFRKHFVDWEIRKNVGIFFGKFFFNEDTESIQVIFRNVKAADRVRLVFSELGLRLIYQWIYKWHVVYVFLREAALSKEEKERLKVSFMRKWQSGESVKHPWWKFKRFFEFVEEADRSAESKRSLGEETSTRVKKLCS